MADKKQTNNHLQTKLDELESLPGEGFVDKNAIWDKLNERLSHKRKPKFAIWWIAAACLLLLVAVPFLLKYRTKELPVKEIVKQEDTLKDNSQKLLNNEAAIITVNVPVTTVLKKSNRQQNTDIVQPKRSLKQEMIATQLTAPVNDIAEVITPLQKEDSPNTSVIVKPMPKAKLSVVNISELDAVEKTFPERSKRHNDLRIKLGIENLVDKPSENKPVIANNSIIKIPLNN